MTTDYFKINQTEEVPKYILEMDEKQLTKYQIYLEDLVWRIKKFNWLPWMKDRWEELLTMVELRRSH